MSGHRHAPTSMCRTVTLSTGASGAPCGSCVKRQRGLPWFEETTHNVHLPFLVSEHAVLQNESRTRDRHKQLDPGRRSRRDN